MAEQIRIRVYNVRFGDALLVSVPDRDPASGKTAVRNILIDVGNVLAKEGGNDEVFQPVVNDILKELDGKALDLYVMTHEHLDHVQGLFHAAAKTFQPGELKTKLDVQYAWLTASAAPDYYDKHPEAKKQKLALEEAYARIAAHLALLPAAAAAPFNVLMANNNPRSTAECVAYLRDLAPPERTFYVHRDLNIAGKHPFKEAKLEIWAPEEDTSNYYKKLLPMALAPADHADTAAPADLAPPPGVDAGAFYDLVDRRRGGFVDNLLAIDKAANNTSLVFAIEWRGKRILFAGDAELASWRMMHAQQVIKPVDVLKVSHHGSHNGTPDGPILDALLPGSAAGRRALISTWDETYGGIPHSPTNEKLTGRCQLLSTLDDRTKLFYDVHVG